MRGTRQVTLDLGRAQPKQMMFFRSQAKYTAYGGAKGGGKTWAVRTKAVGGALQNAGIRILIMRRTYPELEENHIRQVVSLVPREVARYNGANKVMTFYNGSAIKFGHWQGDLSEREYQGLEFDWIFIDEATQFTERSFRYLGGCLRGVNKYPKRMYLTCNPGGVGHTWVKRLFIDRDFITDPTNPERTERPEDYYFIPATIDDNPYIDDTYKLALSQMPNYEAYRYGNWDLMSGAYFKELRGDKHLVKPFRIPEHWTRYRAIDYGLDMLACLWVAVDEIGRAYVYREYYKSGLIVKDAAAEILSRTLPNERVLSTFAPPDMWSRQKDTGRTMADVFLSCGVNIVRAPNDRVQGHMMIKDALAERADGRAGLLIFDDCTGLYKCLQNIQADEKNPDDCAKEPHEVTHAVDALRYFCASWQIPGKVSVVEDRDDDAGIDYDDYMTGGVASDDYIFYD